jgi:hypothetical protein
MLSKKVTTNIIAFIALVVLFTPVLALAGAGDPFGLDTVATDLDLDPTTYDPTTTSIRVIVLNMVMWVMGFIGIAAIVVILIGGVTWMTAGGNEEKVKKGREWIINGAIGLVIAILAYGIATFVEATAKDIITGPGTDGFNF